MAMCTTSSEEVGMGRPMKIEPHVTVEEVKEKLHTADDERQRGKWLVIYNALVDPRPPRRQQLRPRPL
jgi:hypothetical protein